jgi:uncharacterized membrane protein YgcG
VSQDAATADPKARAIASELEQRPSVKAALHGETLHAAEAALSVAPIHVSAAELVVATRQALAELPADATDQLIRRKLRRFLERAGQSRSKRQPPQGSGGSGGGGSGSGYQPGAGASEVL